MFFGLRSYQGGSLCILINFDFSGQIADLMHVRPFLAYGAILSGVTTIMFGMGFFWNIHSFTYYLIVQVRSNLIYRLLVGFRSSMATKLSIIGFV